jgi:hypothetical protein
MRFTRPVMSEVTMQHPIAAAAAILCLVLAAPAGAQTSPQPFSFVAPPHNELNRLYRVDRATGAVTACQYGSEDNAIGRTQCFPSGDGADAGAAGDYDLMASHHRGEAGVFRINRRTGEIAVCYVLNEERVVCTKPAP